MCRDGSFSTHCVTTNTNAGSNWLSMRLAAGSLVGHVAVYNNRHNVALAHWLTSFEVRLTKVTEPRGAPGPHLMPTG